MLKSGIHEHWVLRDRQIFTSVSRKLNELQEINDVQSKTTSFVRWRNLTIEIRKKQNEIEQRERFIDVLKNSSRGQRYTMEKEILRRFVVGNLTCIPKTISFSEMDTLCNELDWIPNIGRSILFLQGDFGNCYYLIASGRVGLYLEQSKDREMVVAREFGHLRNHPFTDSDEELNKLGTNIMNLPVNYFYFYLFIN